MGRSYCRLGKPSFRVFNPRNYPNLVYHPFLTLGLSIRVPRVSVLTAGWVSLRSEYSIHVITPILGIIRF